MNETLSVLSSHQSIRNYTSDPVSDEQLKAIIKAAQSAPTWGNGQQLSVVGVTESARKKEIAEIIGQPWINEGAVFLSFNLDFYRIKETLEAEGNSFVAGDNVDTLLIGSTDVGIALGFATAAAESMGLGIVPIGAIRSKAEEIVDLLELPEYVFPVAGLVIGHPAEKNELKPRLPLEAFYHQESYQKDQASYVGAYEKTFSNYMVKRTGDTSITWADTVARYYSNKNGIPQTADILKKQGFTFN
ncbi:nitroreductase [Bacillus sp. JCM 19046]|nr:nitroreductase [Bacillus sp. JCM 19045]GAF15809.1 nitroreductase [Bacillus sp. JCM 19046]